MMSIKQSRPGIAAALAVAAALALVAGCDRGGSGENDPTSQVPSSAAGASGAGGGAAGGGGGGGGSTDGGGSAAAKAEALEIFNTRCSVCHGMTGKGDGPGSMALDPKPRDFSNHEWQGSVTDEHIEKIVVGGGGAVGKSLFMPPNLDLASKQDVVREIRAHVRTLGR